MLTTIGIVDRLNEWKGWSDYRVAQMLEVSPQAVQKWRKFGVIMSDATALKAAEILGLPEEIVKSSIQLERDRNTPAEEPQSRILDLVCKAHKKEIKAFEQSLGKLAS